MRGDLQYPPQQPVRFFGVGRDILVDQRLGEGKQSNWIVRCSRHRVPLTLHGQACRWGVRVDPMVNEEPIFWMNPSTLRPLGSESKLPRPTLVPWQGAFAFTSSGSAALGCTFDMLRDTLARHFRGIV